VISRLRNDEDHEYSLIAEEWPTFLYDEHAGWNEKDRTRGLFRGHVLVRVSQTTLWPYTLMTMIQPSPQVALRIFRNQTAAQIDEVGKPYDPSKRAKGPADVLKRCGITDVTPRMIAYAAVQVLFHRRYLVHALMTLTPPNL
jgi:hypothetical protein